jgi:hypothetical protein
MAAKKDLTDTFPEEVASWLRSVEGFVSRQRHTAEDRKTVGQALDSVMEYARQADDKTRQRLIRWFARVSGTNLLLGYAFGGAARAVRDNRPDLLPCALLALVLENLRADYRDTLVFLSLIGHSARKLSVPLEEMVDQVSHLGQKRCGQLIRGFFQQSPEHQSIKWMGYREGKSKHGFDYIALPW